ncbi:hypothetical protein [Parasitella parasitica]|uniref:CBS domain-containing protein n=1 Tax=Parasitella parasitica TaxID=35722 RepID=A0A0B7NB01_9FUNG|nr:hypothetical protein [Parasitella parasitica]
MSAKGPQQVPVGNLHCQRDTFCRQFTTECISCSDKPDKKGFYQVALVDTILFPEGGGQPCDTGYIDNVRVYNVQRQKLAHVHYTKEPVNVGPVSLRLDWDRRWDCMQQHSGQHLLSAVLEQEPYNLETVSWSLGEKRSFIELPTSTHNSKVASITPALLNEVEAIVNQLIVKNVPVITHSQEANGNDDDGETAPSRPDSLPKDYVGGGHIRTIEIQGLDKNPCCGTHVLALGQLQCLKLLSTESVRGGNTRVFFLFGQRVLDAFDASYQITRQLTHLLSGGQESFVESVQKIQQQSRDHMKRAKRYLEQLAQFTVNDIAKTLETQRFAVVYKEGEEDNADNLESLGMIANGIRDRQLLENNGKVVVLAAGGRKTGGPLIVAGSDNDIVQKVGKILTSVLSEVKGGGKGRWQGKAKNWDGIENLEKALHDEINSTHSFAGMLTVSDFISLIQHYYYSNQSHQHDVETMRLSHLTDQIKQNYPIHPMTTLYDAAVLMSTTRAHRIPLMDTNKEIVSVMTQLSIGVYGEAVTTATMQTPVIEIIALFAKLNISAVPIVDDEGTVYNMYDTIDVMSLVRSERYSDLDLPVGEALKSRPKVCASSTFQAFALAP